MLAIQVFLLSLHIIPVLLSVITPSVECKPMFFQGYHKKQQKLREARLKKSAAEVRLEELNKKYNRRIKSQMNALESNVNLFHTSRSDWIKKDMWHNKINGTMRRQRLSAKLLQKENPELSNIFDHQADYLQEQSKNLHVKKDEINKNGFTDYTHEKTRDFNFNEDQKVYDKYMKKATKCIDVIQKHKKFIDTETQNQNNCSIM